MLRSSAGVVLVARADDAGSFLAANRGIEQALAAGVVRNVSVMAPASHFDDAAARLRETQACIGLHLTLTAEWTSHDHRWAPVSGTAVPSLVASDGAFFPTPLELFERGLDLEQALVEARAQLGRARAAGLAVRYLDEHMGVGWVHAPGREHPRLRHLLARWAASEGLVWHDAVAQDLPRAVLALRDDPAAFAAAVAALPPRAYCWVTHPACDDDELRAACTASGGRAHERARDHACVTHPALLRSLTEVGVRLARYDELAALVGG
jgi:predicted glycoside hydrolase/deacetylase ChbG (UPF0249 family)